MQQFANEMRTGKQVRQKNGLLHFLCAFGECSLRKTDIPKQIYEKEIKCYEKRKNMS